MAEGRVFKHYPAHHFHSVTHECYAVFKGHSRLLLGRGPLDPAANDDLLVDLKQGDAIVLPAGVAHCSLESSDDYEYVGLYPKVREISYQLLPDGVLIVDDRAVLTGTTTSAKQAGRKRRERPRMRKVSPSLIQIPYSALEDRW